MATCIKGTRFSAMEVIYKKGCVRHATWRWGTIHSILQRFLEVKNSLRLVWDKGRFMGEAPGSEDDASRRQLQESDKDTLKVDMLTKAIKSPKWWCYTEMLALLHDVQVDCSHWAESCPCHSWLSPIGKVSKRFIYSDAADKLQNCRLLQGLERSHLDGVRYSPCPMAGKRAPELAMGGLIAAFSSCKEPALQTLLTNCSDGVTPAEFAEVVDDFMFGSARMLEHITVKSRHWQEFPWRLCALAHWDIVIARAEATRIISDFDRMPQRPESHHRITWSWLNEESPIRPQIIEFSNGADLHGLPLLFEKVAELYFVPTAERRQEGDHSLIERGAQTTASAPYLSLVLRLREVEHICSSVDGLQHFCQLWAEAKPKKAAIRLGLSRHPLWRDAIAERQSSRRLAILLQLIMYSLDAEAQFANMEDTRKRREKLAKKNKPARSTIPFSMGAIEREALVDHLQHCLIPGELYSWSSKQCCASHTRFRSDTCPSASPSHPRASPCPFHHPSQPAQRP